MVAPASPSPVLGSLAPRLPLPRSTFDFHPCSCEKTAMPVLVRENYWVLETAHTAYAFGVTPRGLLVHTYWGARLTRAEDYPAPADIASGTSFSGDSHVMQEEYPAYAGTKYTEPCLKTTFADGVPRHRPALCRRRSGRGRQATDVRVTLRDEHYPLEVVVCYRVHEQHDLVERWVEIKNTGDTAAELGTRLHGPVASALGRAVSPVLRVRALVRRVAAAS